MANPNFNPSRILGKHPLPWVFTADGDTSGLVDANGRDVLTVTWDGLQNEEGGVNDALLYIEECIAFPVLAVEAERLRDTYAREFGIMDALDFMGDLDAEGDAYVVQIVLRSGVIVRAKHGPGLDVLTKGRDWIAVRDGSRESLEGFRVAAAQCAAVRVIPL